MRRSHSRTGFTLIELLVVIAIIAILAGLIVAAVVALRGRGEDIKLVSELGELDAAMQDFKGKWNLPTYPPDQLKLCTNYAEYGSTPLDKQSIQFIAAMFPQLGSFSGIQWAGPGVSLPAGGVVLEGDQVLVFALGGPPAGTNTPVLMGGFSTNPQDPIDVANAFPNRKKFFTFDNSRLKLFPRAGNSAASNFPSYIDPYNKAPYVYFGSNAGGRYSGVANSLGVSAYLSQASPKKFHNPTKFQLIAPGRDGMFGAGGIVWPAPVPPPGADDVSNFSDGRKLGNP